MLSEDPIELLPPAGSPTGPLFILLHGYGDNAAGLLPVAERLRAEYPDAVILLPQGFEPAMFAGGRQWFSLTGITEDNRPQRVADALPALAAYIRAQQDRFAVLPPDTALVGFSQGGIMALELSAAHDGLVGRVIAFAGRYARLPEQAPQLTTIHLLHGDDDDIIPASHSWDAYEHLGALRGDATLDTASDVGHEIHPVLLDQALHRLRSSIPLRTWRRALGGLE